MGEKREQIRRRLNKIFQDVFDDDEIQIFNEMTADDLEEWDSLMQISLVVAIEKKFGFELIASEVGQLKNIGAMIALLEARATK